MNSDYYQALIEERARQPKYFGQLDDADVVVEKEDILANDRLRLMIKLSPDKKRVLKVRWQGQGCVISRAVMETIVSEVVRLKNLDKLKTLKFIDILKQLGLETITPSRFKCADLGWQVFLETLNQARNINA